MKINALILLLTLTLCVSAQDDDFFLRGSNTQKAEPTESTIFQDDLDTYYDDIVPRTSVENSLVMEYEPLREIDVMWERRLWRIIDIREKMNMPFQNFERPFFTILKELAENGDIKIFRDENFKEPLTPTELLSTLNKIDTSQVMDPETYEQRIVVTESPVDPRSIVKFRVKEVWYFDKESSVVKCRILGIAPIRDEYDAETGVFKYSGPLFWVYYPKARHFLAKERVVSDHNDVAPMSWYDLFESRFFASYIFKSSNSLGLRLEDRFPGSPYDQLLESELIKQELFNWEHDLWSY